MRVLGMLGRNVKTAENEANVLASGIVQLMKRGFTFNQAMVQTVMPEKIKNAVAENATKSKYNPPKLHGSTISGMDKLS